jgi:hypothetical protein
VDLRNIGFKPLAGGYDHINIMNGMIGYICALEPRPKRVFKLNGIEKLLAALSVKVWST